MAAAEEWEKKMLEHIKRLRAAGVPVVGADLTAKDMGPPSPLSPEVLKEWREYQEKEAKKPEPHPTRPKPS